MTQPKPLPSFAELDKRLAYDPMMGVIHWRNGKNTGKEAGCIAPIGYRKLRVALNGTIHQLWAHRVAWLLFHGSEPIGDIDHINGDRSDNRIANLRLASRLDNARNTKISTRNKTGCLGVSWRPKAGRWRAQITDTGRMVHIGSFDNLLDAACARKSAEIKYGFHRNHGRAV